MTDHIEPKVSHISNQCANQQTATNNKNSVRLLQHSMQCDDVPPTQSGHQQVLTAILQLATHGRCHANVTSENTTPTAVQTQFHIT